MFSKRFTGFFLLLVICGLASNVSADLLYFTADKVSFDNILEDAAYEADFGLYAIKDPNETYQIFNYRKNPGDRAKVSAKSWQYLQDGFGFYFAVHTGGQGDATPDYFLYSDPSLNHFASGNPVDSDINHFSVHFVPKWGFMIGLDDQLGGVGPDKDYNDMVVSGIGKNIQSFSPTPVPESSTTLFIGIGLLGLGAVGRNFRKREEQ